MQSRAKRKVKKAVAKVKSFLFLLRILKSSVRPVMTASMPPICWTQAARATKEVQLQGCIFTMKSGQMSRQYFAWRNHPACQWLRSLPAVIQQSVTKPVGKHSHPSRFSWGTASSHNITGTGLVVCKMFHLSSLRILSVNRSIFLLALPQSSDLTVHQDCQCQATGSGKESQLFKLMISLVMSTHDFTSLMLTHWCSYLLSVHKGSRLEVLVPFVVSNQSDLWPPDQQDFFSFP